jgi:hypothetical protein
VAIPRRAGRLTPDRIKVSGAEGNRRAPWTAVAGSKLGPATAQRAEQVEQTEQVTAQVGQTGQVAAEIV